MTEKQETFQEDSIKRCPNENIEDGKKMTLKTKKGDIVRNYKTFIAGIPALKILENIEKLLEYEQEESPIVT